MKRIIISGYYGFSNSGDDAVLSSICKDILKKGPNYKAIILSNQPKKTKRDYGTDAVNRKNPFVLIREIYRADVLLMGGGSLLQDETSTRSLLYYLTLITLSILLKTKSILYANGIGPITKSLNRMLVRKIVNKMDLITLRERLSKYELDRLGIVNPEIHITSDPVFNLEVTSRNIDNLFKREGVNTSKSFVTIFFRSWKEEERYLPKVAHICDYIVSEYGMDILFVPMKHPSDIIVANKIQALMSHTESGIVIKGKYDSDTLIELIGQSKFIISMRLHALLYAAIKSIPMIGFVYDPKVKYYLEELEMYSVEDMHRFDESEVEGFITDLMGNYEAIQHRITTITGKQKELAKKNVEYLMALVERDYGK